MSRITRRIFVKNSFLVAALGAAAQYILAACGSSGTSGSGGPTTAGDCATNGATYTVGLASGHSHSGNAMTANDINTGHTGPYGMGTTSAHTHNVILTAANITALQANQIIDVESDENGSGHTHTVRITCS